MFERILGEPPERRGWLAPSVPVPRRAPPMVRRLATRTSYRRSSTNSGNAIQAAPPRPASRPCGRLMAVSGINHLTPLLFRLQCLFSVAHAVPCRRMKPCRLQYGDFSEYLEKVAARSQPDIVHARTGRYRDRVQGCPLINRQSLALNLRSLPRTCV